MSTVDQRAETGASRVRQLLTRALLVVGGTAAGTAAVWTLSTTSASADVIGLDPVTAVAEQVVPEQGVREQGVPQDQQHPLAGLLPAEVVPVVAPVAQVVENVDTALRSERAKTVVEPLEHVAGGFRDTVGTVADRFQPPAQLPATTSRGALAVVDGGTRAVHETQVPGGAVPVIDRSAPADAPVTTSTSATFAGLVEKWTQDPAAQRGALSAEPRSTLPGDPSPLPFAPFAPFAPATSPVHCACGNDGSGSAGAQNAASSAAFVNAYDSAVARALQPATERISVTPGKQPGATPD
ncbi:hypothetical protein [Umezawaea beigongshangensis]|uniref:hypothetical protein n=1 Tax=Umezawaea beigongshangensis TaxID=2780383 RepID=UPI0018F15C38|nr:hypothetical protein [Umezawaea beigongshangensis]